LRIEDLLVDGVLVKSIVFDYCIGLCLLRFNIKGKLLFYPDLFVLGSVLMRLELF